MITLLTALFYLWLVITILLVAMWFLRRLDHLRGSDDDHDLGHDHDLSSGSLGARRAGRSNRRTRPGANDGHGSTGRVDTAEAHNGTERIEVGLRSGPAEPGPGESRPDATPRIEVGDRSEPSEPGETGGRSRRSKPRSGRETRRRATRRPSTPTIDELLDGAVLPYDLTPAPDRITEPERHAILLSTNSDVEAVGTAFADELVRLGFAIEPEGLDQAKAVRGDHALILRISPRAGARDGGDHRRYPTAGEDDVAIEIWTGQDHPPRLA